MSWDWLSNFWEWWTTQRVAATAAVLAASSAIIAAISGVRTLRQSRRDGKARSRPMVAAELRDVPYVMGTQTLVVRNYGPSIARNVRVSFDPEIPDPVDPSQSVTPHLKRRYASPIPILTPGMELDNIYFSGRQEGTSWVNAEPTPEQITAKIKYQNDTGDEFEDTFPLDTNLIRNRTYSESSASPDAQLKILATSAKALAEVAARTERRHQAQAAEHQRDPGGVGDADVFAVRSGEPDGHRALVDRLLRRKSIE